jgi:hypothetical protein
LNFNGTTAYVDFGASSLALTTPFTISTWVYPTSTNYATILCKDRPNCSPAVTQNGYSLTWESSSFRFVINKANGPYNDTLWDSGMTVQTFPLNQWYHVTAVFPADGLTRVKIYVNGVDQALTRAGQAQTAFTTYFNQRTWLGSGFTCSSEPGSQSSYFNGNIDEPAVYSRALPGTEIYAQYLEGLRGKNFLQKSRDANFNALPLDAMSFFNLDENNGNAANDMNLFNNSTRMLLHFDENTGLTANDESPYANNGLLVNGATWTAGISNTAVSLDGTNDYVSVTDIDLPSTFTWSAWIYPLTLAAFQVINKDDGTSRSYYFAIESTGTLIGSVRNTGGLYTQYRTNASVISTGQWQLITMTYDGSAGADQKMKFYVNGQNYAALHLSSYDNGGTPENDPLPVKIGIWGDSVGQPFNGKIDEVAIYSQVLSAGEIGTYYGARKALFAVDGIHYGNTGALYHFDENAGLNAFDSSPYNNKGTITGAAWATGKSVTALSFDGIDDYVSVNDATSLQPQKLSVEAWIKPNVNYNSGSPFSGFVIKNQNNSNAVGKGFYLGYISGTIVFWTADVATWYGAGLTTDLYAGSWYHLVATYNNSVYKLYVNGSQVASSSSAHSITYDASPVWIGRSFNNAGNIYFNGIIDETAIYSKALDQNEISAHYLAGRAKFTDWNTGISGSALSFDGTDDYVSISDKPSVRVSTANFTLSAWIKTSGDGVITDKQKSAMNYNFYGLRVMSNKAWVAASDCGTGGCGWGVSRHPVVGTSTITDNQWHSIVFTRNNTLMSLYVDGTLEASISEGPWDTDSTSDFRIGSISGGAPGAFFNGIIDEVVLYNRPLSAAEIKGKYLAERAGRIDVNYFSAGNESTDSRAKDFNSVNLLMHNPVSTQIDLKKASDALGFENFRASDCRVLADNNLFIDCQENAAIKFRFRNSLIGNTFWGSISQRMLSDKDLRVIDQKTWNSFIATNTDNNFFVTFDGSFKDLNSGTDIASITGKIEEHFIPWLDANGSLDYGTLRIKVQK